MPTKLSPEETAGHLSTDQQLSLAYLHDAGDDIAGYTISEFLFGTRMMLFAYDIVIHPEDDATEYRFTDFGRKVVEACYQLHREYVNFRWSELEEARARREAAKLPPQLQETLGLIASASTEIIELTLIMLPRADRMVLKEHGVIEADFDGPLDDPVWVKLTDEGRKILNGCAYRQLSDTAKQKLRKFETARRDYWDARLENLPKVQARSARRK